MQVNNYTGINDVNNLINSFKKEFETCEKMEKLYDHIINKCIELIYFCNLDIRNHESLYDHIDEIILQDYTNETVNDFWLYYNIRNICDELDYYD